MEFGKRLRAKGHDLGHASGIQLFQLGGTGERGTNIPAHQWHAIRPGEGIEIDHSRYIDRLQRIEFIRSYHW
jgi:hypothetical protein